MTLALACADGGTAIDGAGDTGAGVPVPISVWSGVADVVFTVMPLPDGLRGERAAGLVDMPVDAPVCAADGAADPVSPVSPVEARAGGCATGRAPGKPCVVCGTITTGSGGCGVRERGAGTQGFGPRVRGLADAASRSRAVCSAARRQS